MTLWSEFNTILNKTRKESETMDVKEHTLNLKELFPDEKERNKILKAVEEEKKIFCECDYLENNPHASANYKPDGVSHLGVTKHGWLCPKCNKFVQIG